MPTTTTNTNANIRVNPHPYCPRCNWLLESLTISGVQIRHCFHCGIDYYSHTPTLTEAELNAEPPQPTAPGSKMGTGWGRGNRRGRAGHHDGSTRSTLWGSAERVQAWADKHKAIIERAAAGLRNIEIAQELGISPHSVSRIVTTWREWKELEML